jgi:hypothetical protein
MGTSGAGGGGAPRIGGRFLGNMGDLRGISSAATAALRSNNAANLDRLRAAVSNVGGDGGQQARAALRGLRPGGRGNREVFRQIGQGARREISNVRVGEGRRSK